MKVTMGIEETSKGLLFAKKVFNLNLSVAFEDSELSAIEQVGVKEHILYMAPPADDKAASRYAEIWPEHGGNLPIRVSGIMKGKPLTISYSTLQAAQQGMDDVKGCLRNLKAAIEALNAPRTDNFEL